MKNAFITFFAIFFLIGFALHCAQPINDYDRYNCDIQFETKTVGDQTFEVRKDVYSVGSNIRGYCVTEYDHIFYNGKECQTFFYNGNKAVLTADNAKTLLGIEAEGLVTIVFDGQPEEAGIYY